MDAEDFKTMLICEDVLSNRETLIQMTCADFPTMKSDPRNKLHKSIHKIAYPNNKSKVLTFDALEGLMNG
jgi:hypothetical protein